VTEQARGLPPPFTPQGGLGGVESKGRAVVVTVCKTRVGITRKDRLAA
jgi:hypothetical protein